MSRWSRTMRNAFPCRQVVARLVVEELEPRCLLNSSPATPIQHIFYVVKENRTFDQVFGSLGQGNGDPSLNLFGQESAPNQRALQRLAITGTSASTASAASAAMSLGVSIASAWNVNRQLLPPPATQA